MSNPLGVVIVGQVIFGLGFPIVWLVLLRFIARRRAYRGRSTGIVVSRRSPSATDSIAAMRAGHDTATVRFTTEAGVEVIADCRLVGDRVHVRPGGRVPVLYDPSNPRRIAHDRELGRGVLTAIGVLGVGTVIEVLGLTALALVLPR